MKVNLSDEEIYNGLINGCTTGDIAPVMCGSATNGNRNGYITRRYSRMFSIS